MESSLGFIHYYQGGRVYLGCALVGMILVVGDYWFVLSSLHFNGVSIYGLDYFRDRKWVRKGGEGSVVLRYYGVI